MGTERCSKCTNPPAVTARPEACSRAWGGAKSGLAIFLMTSMQQMLRGFT